MGHLRLNQVLHYELYNGSGSQGSSRTGTIPGVCNGGYNGGGKSGQYLGGGGGGASDIRATCNNYASVLVVAGGGGGGKGPSPCYSNGIVKSNSVACATRLFHLCCDTHFVS